LQLDPVRRRFRCGHSGSVQRISGSRKGTGEAPQVGTDMPVIRQAFRHHL
jgi:tryptophan 2,3-dioxygenase